MQTLRDKEAVRAWSRAQRAQGKTVALVPTMGHLSLVAAARAEGAHAVAVSIYVNPTQFAPGEDFDVDPEGDRAKLEAAGVDVLFEPASLYAEHEPGGAAAPPHETFVTVEKLQLPLCGVARPTHFRGVATVVAKLFNIVEPDVFGRKDYQQLKIITRMVRDLDFAVRVVGAPLMREPDGLAMSSRNVRLQPDERTRALSISTALRAAAAAAAAGERRAAPLAQSVTEAIVAAGGRPDYVELVAQDTLQPVAELDAPSVILVAARFGSVRLLDNWELPAAAK